MAPDEAIDPGVLDELVHSFAGDAAFARGLIDAFLADAPVQLAALRQALDSRDGVAFRRAAHTLKSNGASFGAFPLSAMCRQLEQMGQANALDGVSEALARIEAEYRKVEAALLAYLRPG